MAAALGDHSANDLRATGKAMSMYEAVAYALSNIDAKLLTGPIATIDG